MTYLSLFITLRAAVMNSARYQNNNKIHHYRCCHRFWFSQTMDQSKIFELALGNLTHPCVNK